MRNRIKLTGMVMCLGALLGVSARAIARDGAPAAAEAPTSTNTLSAAARRLAIEEGVPSRTPVGQPTALERYIAHDDGMFSWELVSSVRVDAGENSPMGVTVYHIRMVSQQWRNEREVDRPVWTHWLSAAVPDVVATSTPIFLISGGKFSEDVPKGVPGELMALARASGTIVFNLSNVPGQPTALKVLGADQAGRVEDDLLAETWNLAADSKDAAWIGRFPMVKAAVKGMDAAEAFMSKESLAPAKFKDAEMTGGFKADGFFVTGASKRGWTTWLVGAVDARVKAIAPIVIDVLNLTDHIDHHWRSYGFFSPAVKDYVNHKVVDRLKDPAMLAVLEHEDPMHYQSRVEKLPKYLVNASGDEFFPTDSARHYQSKLTGEWHFRYVPNAGHRLKGSNAIMEIVSFYKAVVSGTARPKITWEVVDGGSALRVVCPRKPKRVVAWTSENAKARDFRFEQGCEAWTGSGVEAAGGGAGTEGLEFRVALRKPEAGYRASFVECVFDVGGTEFVTTTRVYVTPDELPFPPRKVP